MSATKPDWLNNDVIQLMRKRDRAYRKARKTKNSVDWRKATFLRNRVDSFIRNFKKQKITENLNRHKNNPVKFWKEIRTLVPKDIPSEITELKDEQTNVIYNSDQLSNHINQYFVNIGAKLADEITKKKGRTTSNILNALNRNKDGITNVDFDAEELYEVFKLINVNKSSALTNIRSQVLIDSFYKEFERILQLYNKSIRSVTFPSRWKTSIVIPIPKIYNPIHASDMRPISLIPLPGKILEHLISKRIKTFLAQNKVLSENQHGFRKSHSTITSICTLLHNIYNNVNHKKDTYLLYLDLKKAFDTVSHNILIGKLGNIGLDQKTVSWFSNYLNDRKQYVKFVNQNSNILSVSYGVPQGSILGPTLFSIYINDLADLLPPENILLYADDTVLYGSNPTEVQKMLDCTYDWCGENLLTVNYKKSQWMKTNIVSKTTQTNKFSMGTICLEQVKEYKYLGLTMDPQLKF